MTELALAYDVQIRVVFCHIHFCKCSCHEILNIDTEIMDQDVLGVAFVFEVELFGLRREIELCTNGKEIVVDSKNREHYAYLLIQHHYVTSIVEQVKAWCLLLYVFIKMKKEEKYLEPNLLDIYLDEKQEEAMLMSN
ncbi:hypothetical protein H5410_003706 [Solanum commersonii]|uniref:HECT-type E3 ubiquitin transferase n=1 Tax=Solanum commersonii TaxID=4109 RepID=A0A9J6B5E0_SOLCO|nr:hypothetical protein H5410_003706 [Solanum commersonii]